MLLLKGSGISFPNEASDFSMKINKNFMREHLHTHTVSFPNNDTAANKNDNENNDSYQ